MELGIADRLVILSILPKEGDITKIRVIRELREELSFDSTEHERIKFENKGDIIEWNGEAVIKDILIDDVRKNIIRTAFKELNSSGKLNEQHIPLYEKFVEEK